MEKFNPWAAAIQMLTIRLLVSGETPCQFMLSPCEVALLMTDNRLQMLRTRLYSAVTIIGAGRKGEKNLLLVRNKKETIVVGRNGKEVLLGRATGKKEELIHHRL